MKIILIHIQNTYKEFRVLIKDIPVYNLTFKAIGSTKTGIDILNRHIITWLAIV